MALEDMHRASIERQPVFTDEATNETWTAVQFAAAVTKKTVVIDEIFVSATEIAELVLESASSLRKVVIQLLASTTFHCVFERGIRLTVGEKGQMDTTAIANGETLSVVIGFHYEDTVSEKGFFS